MFGQYLERFSNNYVTTYAGLASVIIALVFLYFIASIFVYGGEFNAAIMRSRLPKSAVTGPPAPTLVSARAD
jgi:membrane protein